MCINRNSQQNTVINPLGGNVGIGISIPTRKLHVVGHGLLVPTSNALAGLDIRHSSNDAPALLLINNGHAGVGLEIRAGSGSGKAIIEGKQFDGTLNFVVTGDGKVWAREMETTINSFPDYVFDEDHEMMSLQQLEQYVTKHKHIPGVPTAAEVIENGLNHGEMIVLLWEKLEEAHLHDFEQEKAINELRREIQLLREQMIIEK